MTTENAYVKLSNVTRALGIERGQHDNLKARHETLQEDYDAARQQNQHLIIQLRDANQKLRDLTLKLEQERERNQE